MKQFSLLLAAIAGSVISHSQKVFFKTAENTGSEKESVFFASLNLNDSLVLFNATNYHLYAFNKNTGEQKWSSPIKWKSDLPPFFCGNFIWATNGENQVLKMDPATGTILKTLPASSIETQPYIRNGVLYFTGIYDGGSLIAYDLKSDSILWKRFLAHGYSRTPYYLPDKIVANAEGDHWIELNYDGTFREAGCDKDIMEDELPSQFPCAKQFMALGYNGREIKGKLAEKLLFDIYSEPVITNTSRHSFIVNEGRLFILGKNSNKPYSLLLSSLSEEFEGGYEEPVRFLNADDLTISFLYNQHYVSYNHREKKLLKLINLAEWEPHQAMLDRNNLWLISRKDGHLYGITIN